jgi:N-acetyltransferase 10
MSNVHTKKVPQQIWDIVERNVAAGERSMFLIVGDNCRDQVATLHQLWAKITHRQSKVLWCYKKPPRNENSSQPKKGKQAKEDDANRSFNPNEIRKYLYRDTEKVLGQTFSMCVLEDFEALSPNILCRTIETVEGGGIVMILANKRVSLERMFTIESGESDSTKPLNEAQQIGARFKKRLILSLKKCKSFIAMDDEANILETMCRSTMTRLEEKLESLPKSDSIDHIAAVASGIKPVGDVVVKMSKTVDQANAVLEFTQMLSASSNIRSSSSVRRLSCLTSGRGRGKSAALGMAIGSAIAFGYSNIVVTAPSLENLITVSDFVVLTLAALQYKEFVDFNKQVQRISSKGDKERSMYSTSKGDRRTDEVPDRIVINRNNHRQIIQFVQASECFVGRADILVIDEAAAIPLPVVKKMIDSGNHVTLMSSTVHGYEGTGRALSLKLIDEFKRKPDFVVSELEMKVPIRYSRKDRIEKWLHNLLCLESTEAPPLTKKLVSPADCAIQLVNRDALFSHKEGSEKFLRNIVSLFVSSHYKNSPDDLMLMADAPKHHVLAFCPPISESDGEVPEVYVAIQIALEGRIGSQKELFASAGNLRPAGDMIPWTLSTQFSDTDFGQLNGIRIVRIAVHPSLARMGYGSEAMKQIWTWIQSINSNPHIPSVADDIVEAKKESVALFSSLYEAESAQTLLSNCGSRQFIDFLGTSFGLTLNLFNFWRKSGFIPLYLRQTQNDTTGEFTCMMLRASDQEWLTSLYLDFSMRLQRLLSGPFRSLSSELALSMISCASPKAVDVDILQFLSLYDLRRLRSYSRGEVDYHLITDLIPVVADLIFNGKFSVSGSLAFLAKRILVGMGCQRKTLDELYEEDKERISIPQILGILKPSLDKISQQIEKKLEINIKSQFVSRANRNLVVAKTVRTPDGIVTFDESQETEEALRQPSTPSTEPEASTNFKKKKTLQGQGDPGKKQRIDR